MDNKQIDEMAEEIQRYVLKRDSAIVLNFTIGGQHKRGIAEHLIKKGYRKESDVAKQIFEEIEKIISKNTQYDIKYGQLMVSGYNGRQIARFIDDLKKKYIGEKGEEK